MVDKEFDKKYIREYGKIVGIDEVGRGALAGPVVVAAVILDTFVDGIDDSKKVTPRKREILASEIAKNSKFAIGIATPTEIDIYNVLEATKLAMQRAFEKLGDNVFALIDGPEMNLGFDHLCIVRGDSLSPAIAAASIIAKVYRDGIMRRLSSFFKIYDFEHNVGYGTSKHLWALEKYGPTIFHRFTYAPVYKNASKAPVCKWLEEKRLSKDRLMKI